MPAAFGSYLGTGASTSSGTSLTWTTTGAINVGDLVIIRVGSDNASATTPTFTCSDGSANVYTNQRQGAVNATAAAGVAGAIFTCKATVARSIGTTMTITLSNAVAHKTAYGETYTGVDETLRVAAVSATGTATAASAGATAAGLVAGDIVFGMTANETRGTITGDSDTTNGSWAAQTTVRSATSGSDATCVSVVGQYKVVTATGAQTYNVTAVAAEWFCACIVLQASPPPAITQAAYRFYYDGSEASSVALAAQDTVPTLDYTAGFSCFVRIRLQLTTASGTSGTDDWQLEFDRNGANSWATPVGMTSVQVSEGQATTNRLTGGTGSFVAGKVSLDRQVDNLAWSGNNYTELLFGFNLGPANVLHGDSIRLRVLYNGATTGMTYTVYPTFSVTKLGTVPRTGLVAWLDADDASTFSYSSGVNVSQWRDKGAAGNHFVGPAIGVATRDGTINARTSVRVADHNCSISRTPTPVGVNNDNFAMFMVARRTGGDAANSLMITNGDPAVSGYGIASRAGNANTGILRGGINWNASTTADDGGVHVYTLTRTGGIYGVFIDGVPTSLNGTNPGGIVVPANGTYLPSPNAAHSWGGDLCEALIYDRPMSNEEQLYIQDALKTKWVPVPVGGKIKVWSGSAWVEKPVKVWSGSAWVEKPVKVWNGSAWVLS